MYYDPDGTPSLNLIKLKLPRCGYLTREFGRYGLNKEIYIIPRMFVEFLTDRFADRIIHVSVPPDGRIYRLNRFLYAGLTVTGGGIIFLDDFVYAISPERYTEKSGMDLLGMVMEAELPDLSADGEAPGNPDAVGVREYDLAGIFDYPDDPKYFRSFHELYFISEFFGYTPASSDAYFEEEFLIFEKRGRRRRLHGGEIGYALDILLGRMQANLYSGLKEGIPFRNAGFRELLAYEISLVTYLRFFGFLRTLAVRSGLPSVPGLKGGSISEKDGGNIRRIDKNYIADILDVLNRLYIKYTPETYLIDPVLLIDIIFHTLLGEFWGKFIDNSGITEAYRHNFGLIPEFARPYYEIFYGILDGFFDRVPPRLFYIVPNSREFRRPYFPALKREFDRLERDLLDAINGFLGDYIDGCYVSEFNGIFSKKLNDPEFDLNFLTELSADLLYERSNDMITSTMPYADHVLRRNRRETEYFVRKILENEIYSALLDAENPPQWIVGGKIDTAKLIRLFFGE